MTRLCLAACVLTALVACDPTEETKTDRPNNHNNNQGDDSEGPPIPTNETDCEDGVDEDQDGTADCEDADCATVFRCTWPHAIQHRTAFIFNGTTITCYGWIDYDIPDCRVDFSAVIAESADGACPGCDRSFTGAVTVNENTCQDYGAIAIPTSISYGMVFTGPDARTLWARDDSTGTWSEVGPLTQEGNGDWVFTSSTPVTYDPDECDGGTLHVGDLTANLRFIDQ